MIVGNDIAVYQKDVDYSIYKNNTHFVIIKATEGNGFTDQKFSRNMIESRNNGIMCGFYHFARPDLGNIPEAEAGWFLKVVGPLREGEVLCLDYEPKSNPGDPVDWCFRFLEYVKAHTGCKAYIYLNQSQVRQFNWQKVVDAGYPLWLAAYVPTEQAKPGQWGKMAMQQWTSSQKVPGILGGTGNVDGDWFFGTFDDFKASGYHAPVTPSSSESPSPSPSISRSPSPSSSPSPSISPSSSVSSSPSPSPSSEIPPASCEKVLSQLIAVIRKPWWWIGSNSWQIRLKELKRILYENNL